MQMTDFLHPEIWALWPWLAALACIHLLLLLQQWWWQRRQFSGDALARFGPAISLWRGLLKWALWAAAGACLLLALSVPQGPPVKVEGRQPGADVILCVDVSSSMLAMDIQPNRLQAVKGALAVLLDQLQGDRVGIVAFAGDPVVACPLTSDVDTTALFLEKLDIDSVPRDGTGLGPALKMALDSFNADPERGRLVVLATDGEDTADSDALDQAKRARDMGVPVFTVGIGTAEGALIPGRRDIFGRVYAKMWNGQPVRTKLDSAGLRKIAAAAGGQYAEASDARGLARAAARVRELKQGLSVMPDRYVREPLYQAPLLWALALLLLESLLSLRSGGLVEFWGGGAKRLWRSRRSVQALLVLAMLALPAIAAAEGEGRKAYNSGNEKYRAGDLSGAVQAYAESLEKEPNKADAIYNLGLSMERLEDPETAVEAYSEALSLHPEDQEVQDALARAQRKIKPAEGGKAGKGQKQPPNGPKPGFKEKVKQWAQRQNLPQPGEKGEKAGKQEDPPMPNPRTGAPDPMGRQGRGGAQDMEEQAGRGRQGPPRQQTKAQAAASRLKQDEVQAMMNQLRLDQKRYSGAFNPLKKYERPDSKPEDPMDQMLQQMGMKPPSQKPQQAPGSGPPPKDW